VPLWGTGFKNNVARVEAYLHAKFHPSNRLATVHQRHRQDRTDRQTDRRCDSIGRTVLQTVAQKLVNDFDERPYSRGIFTRKF